MTTITGETGAGKSILLGALALVLGKRADLKSLKNSSQKCVVEATFQIDQLEIKSFFDENDLDYATETILRREINPNGKSRAFVNDTPVNLQLLEQLSSYLIDVHTQYETQNVVEESYIFQILDVLAKNESLLSSYQQDLQLFRSLQKDRDDLLQQQQQSSQDYEYKKFIYEELVAAQLQAGMQEPLEEKVSTLSQVDDIREHISEALQLIGAEELGITDQLYRLRMLLDQAQQKSSAWESSSLQAQALLTEIEDLHQSLDQKFDSLEGDPQALQVAEEQLQTLYQLQQKHQKNTVEELIELQSELEKGLEIADNFDGHLSKLSQQIDRLESSLKTQALSLRASRQEVIGDFQKSIHQLLAWMGMENAQFQVALEETSTLGHYGMDRADFLFAANLGSRFLPLKQVASGGERSRIMLAIKSILAQHQQLPTLIFDEIDTGVSGNISDRMGHIMARMGNHMQLFAITHLPQVAAKGEQQFKVFKEPYDDQTRTRVKELTQEQRIEEIAQMLSGHAITSAAIDQAKELLS